MCASYGLGGGPYGDLGLSPLDQRENKRLLNEWASQRAGTAAITGRHARNLNPIIRANAKGERSVELAWWWIWLNGNGPVSFDAFNSRDDKLLRSWSKPFQHRALLPATWYVEKGKRFGLGDGSTFGIAGLTSTVINQETGDELVSYSMVTRDAVGEAASAWHRMPLVLPAELHDEWLNPGRPGDAELVARVQHGSDEISEAMTVIAVQPAKAKKPSAPTLF